MSLLARSDVTDDARAHGVRGPDSAISDLFTYLSVRQDDDLLALVCRVALATLDGDASRYQNPADRLNYLEALVYALLGSEYDHRVPHLFGSGTELSYMVLGQRRGDFRRGWRILGAVLDHFGGPFSEQAAEVDNALFLLHDYSLFLIDRGDLRAASRLLRAIAEQDNTPTPANQSFLTALTSQDLAEVQLLGGKLPEAERVATESLTILQNLTARHGQSAPPRLPETLIECEQAGQDMRSHITGLNPFARRAAARALMGETAEALADFKRAEAYQRGRSHHTRRQRAMHSALRARRPIEAADLGRVQPPRPPLMGMAALYYADLLVRLGRLDTAEAIAAYHVAWGRAAQLPLIEAYASLHMSDIARLRGAFRRAARWLDYPLAWGNRTGQAEIRARARLAQGRLELARGRLAAARETVSAAFRIADRAGLQLVRIDALVTQARIVLQRGQPGVAVIQAKRAWRNAADRNCCYAWAEASAQHLVGEAELARCRAGGGAEARQKAREALEAAAEIRTRSGDPRLGNTQRVLAELKAL